MAGALVGGAFLSASLQVLFDRIASRPVLDFFKGPKPNAPLLDKLNIKMTTIEKVLDDAEDKQHTNPRVKRWLDELKDAVYEAEDLLDEIASKVQRSKIEAEYQTILEEVKDSASSHEKLEEILKKLEVLVDRRDVLGLIDGTGGKPSYQRPLTSSIPDESFIYGRDADKEAIMKWALSDDLDSSNPDVLAIVGLGGLGKTTLAQHIYRDNKVVGCFTMRAWVCVSEEFNVLKVTKDICEGFNVLSSNANNFDKLQSSLTEVLKGKKFFLVLDNVWSEDYSEWNNVLKTLKYGEKGSKILVTSRNLGVADCIKTSPTHQLQKLSDDDCWLLFEKHAFPGTDVSRAHPALERIGRQIVKKCDGLPLAAKLLGGALRSERNREKWKKILESDMLDVEDSKFPILPTLAWSYGFLPSHLKRCFAYCAVFPKDYEFEKEKLIRLWMAEGLLTQPGVTVDIEQVGEDCFDHLVSRSFFQQSTERKCFLMHDLINVLAKSISRDFCFRYGVDQPCKNPERIRHLWLGDEQVHEVDNRIFRMEHLRTIVLSDWSEQEEVENWLPTFTRFRVLSLCCNMLPDSIGNFTHLRYLNLCHSSIQRLPDSVATLCNLETLLLCGCHCLVELPATIFKLIHLSQLDIRGTGLGKMPPHMGKLKKLGELAYYIVGKESDCSIKELGPLQRLRGHLRIEKLRNVSQVKESEEANLKCKEKLKRLELTWNDEEGGEDSLHERNVLEQLQPHTNIEQLSICGYAGTRFPDWVGDSSFSNMVELELVKCKYCSFLPPLGQLGSLKRLSIIGFDGITVVGPEFYGNRNEPPFGCLERLRFEGMLQWEEWVPYSNVDEGDGAAAAFPLLQVLQIVGCPKLGKTLPANLHSLKALEIRVCSLKNISLDLGPALEKLEIYDCESLECISTGAMWQHLKTLKIEDCPNLKSIWSIWRLDLPSLIEVRIIDCDSLEGFPLFLAPALEKLEIYGCRNWQGHSASTATVESEHLKSLWIRYCPNLKEITELGIIGCDSLKIFPLDLASALEDLEISNNEILEFLSAAAAATEFEHLKYLKIKDCPNLKEIEPTHLPSLTELRIDGCDSLKSFPLDLAPALKNLQIDDCVNLEFISAAATAEFQHLESLQIVDCPNLKEILSTHVPSLTELKIIGCDSLKSFQLDLAPALTILEISGCGNLEFISAAAAEAELEHLRYLTFEDCPNLKKIQPIHLPSLMDLQISRCDQLVSLPRVPAPQQLKIVAVKEPEIEVQGPKLGVPISSNYGRTLSSNFERTLEVGSRNSSPLPLELVEQLMSQNSIQLELKRLVVKGWDSVTSFPLDLFPMLESLEISDCPKLESLSAASQAQPLQRCKSLQLRGCPNLKRLPECMVASLFPSLTELDIYDCPESIVVDLLRISPNLSSLDLCSCCEEAESFPPENTLLPSTLMSLVIDDFPNLTSFDNKVLQSLTCLETLKITRCPKLQSLPEVWPPSTVTSLRISGLENLESLDHWGFSHELPTGFIPNVRMMAHNSIQLELGRLVVEDWDSVTSFPLDLFPMLESLEISGCPKLESLSVASQAQPLHRCKSLKLRGCPILKRLPECMVASVFPSLTKLDIYNCPESIVVDLLRTSPNLSRLNLRSCCEEAESFPPENTLLPSTLMSLVIYDFPNLTSFNNKVLQSLTCLETLKITRCPKLQSLPEVWPPSTVTSLRISGLENLESLDHWGFSHELPTGFIPNVRMMAQNSIQLELGRLVVEDWDSVTSFPLDLFPMLESLQISGCPKLESLSAASQAQPLQRCKSLELWGCPNLKRLPECMVASLFPSLTELDIYNCQESIVVDLLRISPNLSRLDLWSCCEEAESFPPENTLLPSTLISLVIHDFPNLTSFDNKVLQSLTCLETLKITSCPKLQSLPEVWLPSTLTSLSISGLKNLESLDHWGLHRLTSLTDLDISHCPKLQSISHEGPPSSLQSVQKYGCPLLKLDKDSSWGAHGFDWD